jgi:predicted site-specific integrase-resolvase
MKVNPNIKEIQYQLAAKRDALERQIESGGHWAAKVRLVADIEEMESALNMHKGGSNQAQQFGSTASRSQDILRAREAAR